ncbi:2-isopropylmalate synthase [uncultured archaeon]|nr:2-isopropylmalate synthase [uncultured archaeon]
MNAKMNYSDPKVVEQLRRKNFDKVMPYANGVVEALAKMGKRGGKGIILFDTTGRDGMQTEDAFVNPSKEVTQSKIEVVQAIAGWGIPCIEVGYPGAKYAEAFAAQMIAEWVREKGLGTNLVGLAGTTREHIKAAMDAGMDEVHIFSSGSLPHAWTKRRKSPGACADDVVEAVKYAASIGFKKILVSLEDAFSADPVFIAQAANRVADAARGKAVVRYNIPDTIGVSNPIHSFAFTSYMMEKAGVPIDVHFHNDGDCAAINAVYAVAAGATRVHATVNGLGERGGNTSLSKFLVQMYQHHRIIPGNVWGKPLDISRLKEMSEFIAGLSGIPIPANEVGIGGAAFAHVSGIHADGYRKSIKEGARHSVYVGVDPTVYGNKEKVVRSALAGKSNHLVAFEEFGIDVEHPAIAAKIGEITASDTKLSATKHVSDAEYLLNAFEQIEGRKCEALSLVEVRDVVFRKNANGGQKMREGARATITVELDGERITRKGTGNGPVDAAVDALNKAIGERDALKIIEYDNRSMGKGSDAAAQVKLRVQDGGAPMETSFMGPNTTLIAVDAYVQAYNAIRALEVLRHKYPAKQA